MDTASEIRLHPRRAILVILCAMLLMQPALASADTSASAAVFSLDIPSEDLDRALQSLALASQFKLLYQSELVEGKTSAALVGRFTVDAALRQLLTGTDLTYEVKSSGVVFIQKKSDAEAGTRGSLEHRGMNVESAATPSASVSAGQPAGLEEIVVTAQKFTSTIQNTPISMSAMSGDQLIAAGISTVEDFSRSLPGLSMRSAGPGMTEYEARGLASNGGAAPTVGFYLDEVPLSPPAMSETGKVVIDPDLYDVSRIELLRGPQGTLYGSGSMGGTIKVVTNQPKLAVFEGSFQGTLSGTERGGLNGGGNVMLNLPFGDKLALRLVASDSYRSGWIDRIVLNPFPPDTPLPSPPPYSRGNVLAAPVQSTDRDVNTNYLNSVRASLLFKPTDDLSIIATAFKQHLAAGAYDEFDSPPGPKYLAHYEAANVPESVSDTANIYSLTLTYDLGFADLTSASAYWNRNENQVQDGSE
jgi:iron complex outermembrane receptor protein